MNRKLMTVMLAAVLATFSAPAQDASAGEIFSQFGQVLEKLNKKYVTYQSTLAHSDNPRKADRKRQELINAVTDARQSISGILYYKGDKSMHQASAEYFKLLDYNLNEDYSKLVNMKEIAEQSYDKMEAYLMVKEQISKKMSDASEKLMAAQKDFCARNGIHLTESTSELDKQMAKISDVSEYYDDIYLIFFKCSVLEDDLMEAIANKQVSRIEQLRSSIMSYAKEGQAALEATKAYNGDATLVNAAKRAMTFFAKEGEKAEEYTSFMTKEAAFMKLKDQFDSDREMRKNKEAVDKYNAALKEYNSGIDAYNNNNSYLNKYRDETYDNWNAMVAAFFDRHIPVADY